MATFTAGFTKVTQTHFGVVSVDATSNNDTQLNPVGACVEGVDTNGDPGVWFYVTAGGTITVASASTCRPVMVSLGSDPTTLALRYTIIDAVRTASDGDAMVAAVSEGTWASGKFGWVRTYGHMLVNCNSGVSAASLALGVGATAGTAYALNFVTTKAAISNFGYSLAAVSAGSARCFIKCNLW